MHRSNNAIMADIAPAMPIQARSSFPYTAAAERPQGSRTFQRGKTGEGTMPDNRIYQMPEVDAAQMKLMLDSLVINKTLLEMRVTQTESLSISSKIGLLREAALVDDLIHLLRVDSSSHGRDIARQRLAELEVSTDAPPKGDDR